MKTAPIGTARRTPSGYIRVKTAIGQRRWPFEHRLVMAEMIGRPLLDSETVHHLNEDKSDNRPENLVLCESNGRHHKHFHAEAARERGRHAGMSNKGKPKPPEQRAKMSAASLGKPKSAEACANMSAARKGKPLTEAQRARYAQWRATTHCKRGHPYTEANTKIDPKRGGARTCRECQREPHRLQEQARRARIKAQSI